VKKNSNKGNLLVKGKLRFKQERKTYESGEYKSKAAQMYDMKSYLILNGGK